MDGEDTMTDDANIHPRRQFCLTASRSLLLGALGSAVGSMLQGCGGNSPTGSTGGGSNGIQALPVVSATDVNGGIAITIDASSPLAAVGVAVLAESANAAALVVRTGPSDFTALQAICTHQACTISGQAGGAFVCPCHGSEFSASGQVLSGPARVALPRYKAQLTGNVLTISS